MRILVIPDIHEKDCWKERVLKNDFDKVIFLGDYVDSFEHNDKVCISNLQDILTFKEALGDKCILLLGNHDIHYMYSPEYRCSGFKQSCAGALKLLYNMHKDLFKVAHLEGDYLFTHAGISEQWYKYYNKELDVFDGTIDEKINAIHNSSRKDILFTCSNYSGGPDLYSGPVWLRPNEEPILESYHQIVGHTPMDTITRIKVNSDTSITYTDVLDTEKDYLRLNI